LDNHVKYIKVQVNLLSGDYGGRHQGSTNARMCVTNKLILRFRVRPLVNNANKIGEPESRRLSSIESGYNLRLAICHLIYPSFESEKAYASKGSWAGGLAIWKMDPIFTKSEIATILSVVPYEKNSQIASKDYTHFKPLYLLLLKLNLVKIFAKQT